MSLLATAVFLIAPLTANPAARHENVQPSNVTQPMADERIPLSIWSSETRDAVHLQSSLACGVQVGALARIRLMTFDNFGFDVGCGYSTNSVLLSMFFHRRSQTQVSEDFESAKNALLTRYPTAKPLAASGNQPAGMSFLSAAYESSPGLREGLWVADVSGWTLTFRASFDPAREKDVVDAITALATKTASTAGIHLADCASAPPAVRNGSEITDKDRLMTLSLVASVSEGVAEDKGGTPALETWCAESPAGDQDVPMLFWRNIASDGIAGRADRLSLMTMDVPPHLLVSANPTASVLDDKSAKAGNAVYQLTGRDGKVISVYAFFAGRPGLPAVDPIGKAIFTGRRAPLASFDPDKRSVTIQAH